jgi:hypothetical protein
MYYILGYIKGNGSSIGQACSSLASSVHATNSNWVLDKSVVKTETSGDCYLKTNAGGGSAIVPVSCSKIACPTGRRDSFDWWADRSLPAKFVLTNALIYVRLMKALVVLV